MRVQAKSVKPKIDFFENDSAHVVADTRKTDSASKLAMGAYIIKVAEVIGSHNITFGLTWMLFESV